jgi:riboflavin kinase/FMN adenylyltransferase
MQITRGLAHLKPYPQGCVLSIGNFDGVHLGHKAVIKKVVERGQQLTLPVVIMIFEPQPLEYFLKDNEPPRLMRLREKILKFSTLPIDQVIIVRFNRHFANYQAEQFIDEILLKKLNLKHLVIGDDFHFGKARQGNFALLTEQGKIHNFTVEDTGSFETLGLRVSSTLIRDALRTGDLAQAERLLGRCYSICGRVAHGYKRGRLMGFPTANIMMARKNTPVSGVFAVLITGIDEQVYQGIANVGTRPTFSGGTKVIVETHLFNFNKDIYGHYVEIHFKEKIRDELCFNSMQDLKQQIECDILTAKTVFATPLSCYPKPSS